MLSNPLFYIAISFGLFLIFLMTRGRKTILELLDSGISNVVATFDSREKLNDKISTILQEELEKQESLERDVKAIIEDTHKKAHDFRESTKSDIAILVKARKQNFIQLCDRMEYKFTQAQKEYASQTIKTSLETFFKSSEKEIEKQLFQNAITMVQK